jgi:hypothetical protein
VSLSKHRYRCVDANEADLSDIIDIVVLLYSEPCNSLLHIGYILSNKIVNKYIIGDENSASKRPQDLLPQVRGDPN